VTKKRRKLTSAFKAKVALEALKGDRPLSEIASEFGVHANQITKWKKQLLENSASIFNGKQEKTEADFEKERDNLYRQIGQLQVEVDWLKKNTGHLD
jgi:transposase